MGYHTTGEKQTGDDNWGNRQLGTTTGEITKIKIKTILQSLGILLDNVFVLDSSNLDALTPIV